jgi:hypothetical protein
LTPNTVVLVRNGKDEQNLLKSRVFLGELLDS